MGANLAGRYGGRVAVAERGWGMKIIPVHASTFNIYGLLYSIVSK